MTAFPAREWAAAAGIAAIALALFAFGRPALTTASEQIDVESVGKLSYSKTVDTPGVYAENRIRTGDPVFLSVASAIDTHLDYALGLDPNDVTGTIRSSARMSASNGWSREIPLGAAAKIDNNHIQRSFPLDFAALLKIVRAAEQQAETSFGSYTVEVVHDIDARGTVSGQPAATTSRPKLTFAVSDQQAILQGGPATIGKPVTATEASSVTVPGTASATVTVLEWHVPISWLRVLAIVLGLAALGLAALLFSGRGAGRRPTAIFGSRLIRADNVDFGDRSLVDVDDTAALAKLATMYDTVVLHVPREENQLFLVAVDQTVYRCTEPAVVLKDSPKRTRASAT